MNIEAYQPKNQLTEKLRNMALFILCLIVVVFITHAMDNDHMKSELHFIISNSVMTTYTIPDGMEYGGEQAQGRCLLPNGGTQLLKSYFNIL